MQIKHVTQCSAGVLSGLVLLGFGLQTANAAIFETGLDLPMLAGPYATGSTYYQLLDLSRDETFTADPLDKRQLGLQVWYPAAGAGTQPASYIAPPLAEVPDFGFLNLVRPRSFLDVALASDQAAYPVLLFSHGFGELSQTYTAQAEALASHGYIVASVTHPYDALVTGLLDGQIIPQDPGLVADFSNPETAEAASIREAKLRAADLQFVLDELGRFNTSDPQNRLTARLDLERVGVFGHSLGGAAAAEAMRLDPRFGVGLNLDGTLWGEVVEAGLDRPFMLMNSEDAFFSDESKQTFFSNLRGDRYNLTLAGAKHHNFADAPFLLPLLAEIGADGLYQVGSIDPERGAALINQYTLAFFDQYLKGQPQPLLTSPSPYEEVSFEYRRGDPQAVPEPGAALGFALLGVGWCWQKSRTRQPG
jgi:predicted dienelactone hydrolase